MAEPTPIVTDTESDVVGLRSKLPVDGPTTASLDHRDTRTSRRIPRWLVWTLGGAAGLVILVGALNWASSGAEPDRPIAEQWNQAITRLGFEPVYPPVEDILVGDLYAIISKDELSDLKGETFVATSMKLMHRDLTKEIAEVYRQTYQFPDTTVRPAEGVIWTQTAASDGVFKVPNTRTTMPLVLFPGFTVEKRRTAGASGGGLPRLWNAVFGASASGTEVLDVKLGGTETYGIDAVTAEYDLFDFCNDKATKLFCTDQGLRKQLSVIVGDKIYEIMANKTTGEKRPRFTVEVGLVYRVFLTRSIETRLREDSVIGGNARAGEAPAPRQDQPPAPPGGANAGQPQAAREALPANDRRGPNAAASFERGLSSNVIIPSTVMPRPVVVGFRTVRWRGTTEDTQQ
jgi:hypothetical protein